MKSQACISSLYSQTGSRRWKMSSELFPASVRGIQWKSVGEIGTDQRLKAINQPSSETGGSLNDLDKEVERVSRQQQTDPGPFDT